MEVAVSLLRCPSRRRMEARLGNRVVGCAEPFGRRSGNALAHRSHIPGFPDRRLKGFFTSIKVMLAVIADHQTKGGERLLLLCLARYAGDDGGRVFPSVETLCADSQQVRRAVQYQLRRLEAKGLIERVGATYAGTANYRIVLHRLRPHPAQKLAKVGASESAGSAPRAPDMSIESTSKSQKPLDQPHVKSHKGAEAMRAIEAFLPKFKSAYREKQ